MSSTTDTAARFLAVDWGTTNRRAWLLDGGTVLRTERDDRGVTAIAPGGFAAEAAILRTRFGNVPMLLAGMAGSNIGWHAVPYVPVPATLDGLAAATVTIAPGVRIVPGVAVHGDRPDVMRGEEVTLLGALALGLVPPDALLCKPGTHCKWVELRGGAIAAFTTAMTGELFALLRGHGVLKSQLARAVTPGPAFDAGLAEGARRDLAASLFGIRARGIMGTLADADAASYASGILIGADVAARLADRPAARVHILADPAIGGLFATAVAAHGGTAVVIDSEAAFIAGIVRIWDRLA